MNSFDEKLKQIIGPNYEYWDQISIDIDRIKKLIDSDIIGELRPMNSFMGDVRAVQKRKLWEREDDVKI